MSLRRNITLCSIILFPPKKIYPIPFFYIGYTNFQGQHFVFVEISGPACNVASFNWFLLVLIRNLVWHCIEKNISSWVGRVTYYMVIFHNGPGFMLNKGPKLVVLILSDLLLQCSKICQVRSMRNMVVSSIYQIDTSVKSVAFSLFHLSFS